jgi:hypothetical protein
MPTILRVRALGMFGHLPAVALLLAQVVPQVDPHTNTVLGGSVGGLRF